MMHPKSALRSILARCGEAAVFAKEGTMRHCMACILPRAYVNQLVSEDMLTRFGRMDGGTFVYYGEADGEGGLLEDGDVVLWGGKRYRLSGLHEYRFGGETLYRRAAARLDEEVDADEPLF